MTVNERLERSQWDTFWCPADVTVVDRPELLYLTCPRNGPYLNFVPRTRASAERLPALIAEVQAAHAHATSYWMVPDTFDTRALMKALAEAGYQPGDQHRAVALRVDEYRPRQTDSVRVREVNTMERLRDSIAVAERAFDYQLEHSVAELQDQLRRCTGEGPRTRRFVAYDAHGRAIAAGGMNLFPSLDMGFLWGGGTVPDARGQGAYSALVAARVACARALGIGYLGLYAREETSAPIVARQGFEAHGHMTVWRATAATPTPNA